MRVQRSIPAIYLTVLLVLTGCLSGSGTTQPRSPSPTPAQTTPVTQTPTVSPTSSTPDIHDKNKRAMKQPDPDKEVIVENQWNQSVTVHVRVVREITNTTVHNERYQLDSGNPSRSRSVYDTTAAEPDGIEEFTVEVTARNTTKQVMIRTSMCYGSVYAEIREDGELYLYYAIC